MARGLQTLAICILLVCGAFQAFALDQTETDALEEIFHCWPVLATASPPWRSNMHEACDYPPYHGIQCTEYPNGHISGLNFSNINLANTIPAAIGSLFGLETLTINNCSVVGQVPNEITRLENLTTLWIYDAMSWPPKLSGSIPSDIGRLTRLETFGFVATGLTSTLPKSFSNLSSLSELTLGSIDLVGPAIYLGDISSLCGLLELQSLDLTRTGLTFVENCFPQFSRLQSLRLSSMPRFQASIVHIIPDEIDLRYLDLSYTAIDGFWDVAVARNLEYLNISNTAVSCYIDDQRNTNLLGLKVIDISRTQCSANFALQSCEHHSWEVINLSYSRVIFTLPSDWSKCHQLRQLSLLGIIPFTTTFSASIPTSIITLPKLTILEIDVLGLMAQEPLPDINLAQNPDFLEFLDFLPTNTNGNGSDAIKRFPPLKRVILSGLDINGTIPQWISQVSSLEHLDLSENLLTGDIPSFGPNLRYLDLATNDLTGEIGREMGQNLETLILRENRFNGTIPVDIFISNPRLIDLDLSDNYWNGTLPEIGPFPFGSTERRISLSYNYFTGTIPASYGPDAGITALFLDSNDLEGKIPNSPPDAPYWALETLDIGHNRFSEINMTLFPNLINIVFSNNLFEGGIPDFPPNLQYIDASHNAFSDHAILLFGSIRSIGPQVVDFSYNQIYGNIQDFLRLNCSVLSLSHNLLSGAVTQSYDVVDSYCRGESFEFTPCPTGEGIKLLQWLDLSFNSLSDTFPTDASHGLSLLSYLNLKSNHFTGDLKFQNLRNLVNLDLSQNQFAFTANQLSHMSLLDTLDISNNQITGTLAFNGLTSLKRADLSHNLLSQLELPAIATMFTKERLQYLSIFNNSKLPQQTLDNKILLRTDVSSPSTTLKGVICYQIIFSNPLTHQNAQIGSFVHDENLFSYQQCECDGSHFGYPPQQCFECPTGTYSAESVQMCKGNQFNVGGGYFVYALDSDKNSTIQSAQTDEKPSPLAIEICRTDMEGTNCNGLKLSFNRSSMGGGPSNLPSEVFSAQCSIGSTGRLCSRCECDVSGRGSCFYLSGSFCKRCSRVMSPSRFLMIFGLLYMLAIVVLSVLMFLVLRNKRNFSVRSFSWPKRLGSRLIHMSTLGNVSILISFIQLVSELTHWDAYLFRKFALLANGDLRGIALVCLFPTISNPLSSLLLRLFLPFIVLIAFWTSIGLAELAFKILDRKSNLRDSDGDEDDNSPLIDRDRESSSYLVLNYPVSALITTYSITVIRFFYFSSALAAHEYLFAEIQPLTSFPFLQSHTWLDWNSPLAKKLRLVSLPFVILYVIGIPILFLILAWKLRVYFRPHNGPGSSEQDGNRRVTTLELPLIQAYFGTLFDTFKNRWYWWEIVNVLKKLATAMILNGLDPDHAVQPTLLVIVIGTACMLTSRLRPWKRREEYFSDVLAGFCLLLNLVASRTSTLPQAAPILHTTLAVNILFILYNIAVIGYYTVTEETEHQKKLKLLLIHAFNTKSDDVEEPFENHGAQSLLTMPHLDPIPSDSDQHFDYDEDSSHSEMDSAM